MGTDKRSDSRLTELAFIWGVSALGGILACVMIYNFAEITLIGAVFCGLVLTGVVGLFLTKSLSGPLPPPMSAAGAHAAQAPAAPVPNPPVPHPPVPHPPSAPKVSPTARLAGEEDLATRKGSWKYEPEPAAPAAAPSDADRPQGLEAAREGGADDLKVIKGVGPKLEALLHSMGYYHYDQIAAWTEKEVAWVDENLEGFKGRVTRDDWVAQAKDLAKG